MQYEKDAKHGARNWQGIRFNGKGEAELRYFAPRAEQMELLLTDTNNRIPLRQEPHGYWILTTDQLKPGARYKLVMDNEKIIPDPASLSQPEGVHGDSCAIDLNSFTWTDHEWQPPSMADLIIYELHTGTFSREGDFNGIAEKLDHLLDLGVNAIEIMPVSQFPGNRNWGYDGVFPSAVQESYGGAEGLQQLVDHCHKKGMAVILDVVYNHFGPEGNYFSTLAPFTTSHYHTPWGGGINFDDAWSYGIREYFISNALMWLRDFHIDGLRLDAVHAIRDFSPKHFLSELREDLDELMQETGRKHFLIVESDLNDPRFIAPPSLNGYGMDAQWVDEFHHALRVSAGEPPIGYYSDFNGLPHLAKSFVDAYVYDGQYSEHRKKFFGLPAGDADGSRFVVFSQNHDQVGNRMMGERAATIHGMEMQKLMAGMVMLSPFIPLLFMGEEYGETNPFLYFVSHGDKELAKAVTDGRRNEFAAFHREGEVPDPVAEETFLRSKLQWELMNAGVHAAMLSFYKRLIQFRKTDSVFATRDRNKIETVTDTSRQLLILHRWLSEDDHRYVYANFSVTPLHISTPGDGKWKIVFQSADEELPDKMLQPGTPFELPPASLKVLSNKDV